MLMIDNMLSYKLKKVFSNIGVTNHVSDLGLQHSYDLEIWNYASKNKLSIITKDFDFIDIQNLNGFPPKLIIVTLGNVSNKNIESYIETKMDDISSFLVQDNKGLYFI